MFPLNVSTIGLPKMMKSHKGYIYLTCLPFDIDCNSFPDFSFCHISGSQTTHFRSKSSQSRPRFSRLPFWPAGFILPHTHWNLNDIFFPIWILWGQCANRPKWKRSSLFAQEPSSPEVIAPRKTGHRPNVHPVFTALCHPSFSNYSSSWHHLQIILVWYSK